MMVNTPMDSNRGQQENPGLTYFLDHHRDVMHRMMIIPFRAMIRFLGFVSLFTESFTEHFGPLKMNRMCSSFLRQTRIKAISSKLGQSTVKNICIC